MGDLLRFGRVVAGALRLGGRRRTAERVGFVVTCGNFFRGLVR